MASIDTQDKKIQIKNDGTGLCLAANTVRGCVVLEKCTHSVTVLWTLQGSQIKSNWGPGLCLFRSYTSDPTCAVTDDCGGSSIGRQGSTDWSIEGKQIANLAGNKFCLTAQQPHYGHTGEGDSVMLYACGAMGSYGSWTLVGQLPSTEHAEL